VFSGGLVQVELGDSPLGEDRVRVDPEQVVKQRPPPDDLLL